MERSDIEALVEEFAKETHGRTDYGKDTIYVQGDNQEHFIPLRFLIKKREVIQSENDLLRIGYIFSSYDYAESDIFRQWYEHQFQKRPTSRLLRNVNVLYFPDQVKIFNALEVIFKNYEILRETNILINGKNLPVQVGEWYAKGIFGLKQVKSTSQRGFDFELDGKLIDVKTHWSDSPSPKGMKVKRSSVELSDFVILMYVSSNFTIRDICFLDSEFIKRKFGGKGHTVFLKDSEISNYFFSKSDKHFDKVVNKSALMKFSSPTLAMKLAGRI